MIKVIDYYLMHPSLPYEEKLNSLLYTKSKPQDKNMYLELPPLDKATRKKIRRMNRVSKFGYLTASEVLDSFFERHHKHDPWRFGTIFSTSFASYDNVISHLKKLYSEGTGAVSPIEFTYAVGNAVISGITINYTLKGPSGSFPDSDVLPVARHYFEQGSCDYILWASFNTLIPEIASYYEDLFKKTFGDKETIPENDMKLKQRIVENYNAIILGNESGEGVYLEDVISHQKATVPDDQDGRMRAEIQMQQFEIEDIKCLFDLLEKRGCCLDEVDAVISAAFGHPSYDGAERRAIEESLPHAARIYPHKILNYGPSGSFAINSMTAFEILRTGSYPSKITRNASEGRPKKVLCLGVNEMGNLSGGVWIWKQD